MRDDLDPVGWLARAARHLDASPLEVVGLAVVLLAGIALTALQVVGPLLAARHPRPGDAARAPVSVRTGPGAGVPSAVASPATVTVYVAGAVARPGVVTLADGARVADAIRAAAGPTPDADLSAVNLARLLADGERVLVPTVGESAGNTAGSATGDTGAGPPAGSRRATARST